MDLLLQAAAQPHVSKRAAFGLDEWSLAKRPRDEEEGEGLSLLSRASRAQKKTAREAAPHAMLVSRQPGAAHYRSLAASPFELATSSAAASKLARAAAAREDSGAESDEVADQRRSSLVDGVPQPLSLQAPAQPLLYEDLINFPRARGKTHARRCVMCGHLATGEGATCSIPLQNKDVCKRCDTGIWRHKASAEYFKWCKGCKKFLHVCSFAEKLSKCTTKYSKQPSKCDRCRERGRQGYMRRKGGAGANDDAPPRHDDDA